MSSARSLYSISSQLQLYRRGRRGAEERGGMRSSAFLRPSASSAVNMPLLPSFSAAVRAPPAT